MILLLISQGNLAFHRAWRLPFGREEPSIAAAGRGKPAQNSGGAEYDLPSAAKLLQDLENNVSLPLFDRRRRRMEPWRRQHLLSSRLEGSEPNAA
jgi:hypothetical protein